MREQSHSRGSRCRTNVYERQFDGYPRATNDVRGACELTSVAPRHVLASSPSCAAYTHTPTCVCVFDRHTSQHGKFTVPETVSSLHVFDAGNPFVLAVSTLGSLTLVEVDALGSGGELHSRVELPAVSGRVEFARMFGSGRSAMGRVGELCGRASLHGMCMCV